MPAKVFWADPFLTEYAGQLYVFFENFSYPKKKGKISAGKITKTDAGSYTVTDVCDVLERDYHLSYPQIVEEDGEIFLIPETHQNKRLEIYRCLHFPKEWELYTTAFEGESVVAQYLFTKMSIIVPAK